jgi:hypothetical protein
LKTVGDGQPDPENARIIPSGIPAPPEKNRIEGVDGVPCLGEHVLKPNRAEQPAGSVPGETLMRRVVQS